MKLALKFWIFFGKVFPLSVHCVAWPSLLRFKDLIFCVLVSAAGALAERLIIRNPSSGWVSRTLTLVAGQRFFLLVGACGWAVDHKGRACRLLEAGR